MHQLSNILNNAVKKYPNHIAIDELGKGTITYTEFHQTCIQLKDLLKRHHIDTGSRVGIFIPKSAQSLVAIFGTLAADAAYISADTSSPASRAAYIFADCKVNAILVGVEYEKELLSFLGEEVEIHSLPNFEFKLVIRRTHGEGENEMPKDLAYMLYTSGSTGNPKGVMISHQNAICFIEWCAGQFEIDSNDVVLSIAPFHFDLSIFDLYVTFLNGGTLALIDEKAIRNPRMLSLLLQEKKISVIYATPTFFKLLVNHGKCERFDHSAIRLILFAGEVFPIPPLRKLKEIWDTAQFYNLYGPTETNVVTWFQVPEQISAKQTAPFPIGKTCPFAICKIWKEAMVELLPGASGELIVSGESVAIGYWNLPGKNEVNFLEIEGTQWYRTGDIVMVNDQYELVYQGREDRMVKRNGYRIELAEIEKVLHQHPQILEAGVVSMRQEKEGIQIKAYLKTSTSIDTFDIQKLREHCLKHLPVYMLPDHFLLIDHFPKTSSLKIDYQQLMQHTS